MNKWLSIALFCFLGASLSASGQSKTELLHDAIGYYQQLEFEKSLEFFDQLVELDSSDISMMGRRGFVCCQYIIAVDEQKISKIDAERYRDVVELGIADLEKSLEKYPNNADNKRCLKYLRARL